MNLAKRVLVRRIESGDIDEVARIHSLVFPRQTFHREQSPLSMSLEWVLEHFPRKKTNLETVYVHEGRIAGYSFWKEKGGFRERAIIELEQIGVNPEFQGMGVGTSLINESYKMIDEEIRKRGAHISRVIVTTGRENEAQRLYERTLGARVVAVIPNLYSGKDEVIMIAEKD